MKGIPLRAIAAHGEQVSAMRALARPVDVLTQAALVALHDVVSPAPHRSARGQREREQAKERGLSEDRKPPYADARDIALPRGAQQIDVVSAGHELAQEPGRGGLNAAEERERTADDGDLHHAARARRAITRSTSGKRSRRAASKL